MIQGLDYGGTQDRGRRPYQEDSFHLGPLPGPDGEPDSLLIAMADGMGGHDGGAQASAAAIEAFVGTYVTTSEPEAERLQSGLLAANRRIARETDANPSLRGMGCTLVGISLTSEGLHLISVGDSPVFLFRNGEMTRLNADHSMAPVLQEAVRMGTLSEEEMARHPHRNALRSAVVGGELDLVDLRREPMTLLPGDKVVVASDGILTLPEQQITQLLKDYFDRPAEELSGLLVKAVTGAGDPHQDNVTVLLAALPPVEAVKMETHRGRTGRLWPTRQSATAAWETMMRPSILASLGTGFLLAALAVGVATTWIRGLNWPTPPTATTPSPEATTVPAAGAKPMDGGGPQAPAEGRTEPRERSTKKYSEPPTYTRLRPEPENPWAR